MCRYKDALAMRSNKIGIKPRRIKLKSDNLSGSANELIMVHPFKTRVIAAARIKKDGYDSMTLAYFIRLDLIPLVYTPDLGNRDKKNLFLYR